MSLRSAIENTGRFTIADNETAIQAAERVICQMQNEFNVLRVMLESAGAEFGKKDLTYDVLKEFIGKRITREASECGQ